MKMPVQEMYRGVGIHAFQEVARVAVVKRDIDAVYSLYTVEALLSFVEDYSYSPEGRLFAGAKILALHESAAGSRTKRPDIDLDLLKAHLAGLDSLKWADPWHYGTLLQPHGPRDSRPCRTESERAAFEAAKAQQRSRSREDEGAGR